MERNSAESVNKTIERTFDLTSKAIKHFGKDAQIHIIIEELAELQQAICKMQRGGSLQNLIEEIADVRIVLTTLTSIYDINFTDIIDAQAKKLDRLEKWLNNNISSEDTLKYR